MSRKPRGLTDADAETWREAMRSVRRLRAVPSAEAAPPPGPAQAVAASVPVPVPVPVPLPVPAASRAVPASEARARGPVAAAVPPLVVGTRGRGLDDGSWRALGSGRLAPSRRLDLHGRTANAALAELQAFLARASADRLRCVEIVTGLGSGAEGGVLRRELPHWLNRPELRRLIVAASEAQPGNPGALRLILRRRLAGRA